MKMHQLTRAFLGRVQAYGGVAKSCQLAFCDRAEDKARQKARRYGWATYAKGKWAITKEGVAALKLSDAPPERNPG